MVWSRQLFFLTTSGGIQLETLKVRGASENKSIWPSWFWFSISKKNLSEKFESFVIFESYLKAAKTWSARQCDITDIRWRGTRHWFVNDQCPILQICTSGLFHLPEILQRLHHINCKRMENPMNFNAIGSHIILSLMRIIIVAKPSIMIHGERRENSKQNWSDDEVADDRPFIPYGQWIRSLENHSYHFITNEGPLISQILGICPIRYTHLAWKYFKKSLQKSDEEN